MKIRLAKKIIPQIYRYENGLKPYRKSTWKADQRRAGTYYRRIREKASNHVARSGS